MLGMGAPGPALGKSWATGTYMVAVSDTMASVYGYKIQAIQCISYDLI